nr:DUF6445 family protein [Sphingomonas sp.]
MHRIGREAQPLVVLDGFAADPDGLREAAMAAGFGPGANHYPGIRAPLPEAYLEAQLPVIAEAVRAMGVAGELRVIDASFSIVTTPPAELGVRQRLPHVDAFAENRIALVHYLSPEGGDGTAFYRHRSTGFETIDESRAPIFFDQLEAELRMRGMPPAAYIAGDTPLFEQIGHAEARYNRALLYPSWLLHSGAIAPDAALSSDPAAGRLTVTGFLVAE